jgi:protein O-mannosyl-transferase
VQKATAATIDRAASGPRALRWWSAGALGVAVLAAYHNTFGVPFLLDDTFTILENESVHRIGAWWAALFPREQVFTAGRPLLNLSFALNYAAGGFSVTGYHVVNLLIHGAAALTLWAIVRRTLALGRAPDRSEPDANRIALIAAFVWALHPVQTVSVTYISQRAESLMALCYLLTLYCFIKAAETRRLGWCTLTFVACLAGMMVKEVMVTAPLIVFLYDRTFISGSFREAWRLRKGLHLGLAATWLVLFAFMFGTRVAERGVGYGFNYSWFDYLRIESSAVLHYLHLAFWPFPLVFDYGQEAIVPSALHFVGNVIALLAIFAAIGFGLWRRPILGFLGCWFFLILAPTSSVVPVAGQPVAENRMYLPLAAVAVLLASGHTFLGRKAVAVAATGALALGVLTVNRNRTYVTEVGIWLDTVAKRPGSSRAHLSYGSALLRAKLTQEGIRELETAIRLNPNYAPAHANLAYAYFEQKRFDDAIRHFQAVLAIEPNDPIAHSNYGAALFQVSRWDEALQQFLEALRLRPTHPSSRVNAGILLARLGRPAEAIAMFEETLRMYPNDASARDNIAQLRAAIQAGTYKANPATP